MPARVAMFLLLTAGLAFSQMNLNGRMETVLIDAQNGSPIFSSRNNINHGFPTFLWRFRGYLDMKVTDRSLIFSDVRLQPDGLQIDFAAIRLYLNEQKTFGLQAGVLGTFIGNVMPRRSSKYNPLIHLPIMYDYFTSLPDAADIRSDQLYAQRGTGQGLRVFYLGVYRPGVEFFITLVDKITIQIGVYNSSPSNPYMINQADKLNFSQRIGVRPLMGLNVGFSVNKGPYLSHLESPGRNLSGSDQLLYDIDASFERGHISVFSEAVYNRWKTPLISEPLSLFSFYVEGKYKFHPHYFAAIRYGRMDFVSIRFPGVGVTSWDDDVQRLEVGMGYYIERETLAKLVYQFNQTDRLDPKDDYIALQLSAGF